MSIKNLNSDINALGDMGSEEFPESLEKIIRFDGRKALIVPVNSKRQILIQDRLDDIAGRIMDLENKA